MIEPLSFLSAQKANFGNRPQNNALPLVTKNVIYTIENPSSTETIIFWHLDVLNSYATIGIHYWMRKHKIKKIKVYSEQRVVQHLGPFPITFPCTT